MKLLALALALIIASEDPPPRGHDPFVFRCTLDKKPRMLVIALSPGWWMAFDTQTCTIHKVWEGDVDFTGPVYDTRHGPQPAARGDVKLTGHVEMFINGRRSHPAATEWRGYRIDSAGNVVIMFDVDVRDVATSRMQRPKRVEFSPTFEPIGRGGGRLNLLVNSEVQDAALEIYVLTHWRAVLPGKPRPLPPPEHPVFVACVKALAGNTEYSIEFLP